VTITSPIDGAIVQGTITITIDSNANPTIAIDGTTVGSGLSYIWDTTQYADGSHTILAAVGKVKDTATVSVSNGGGGGGGGGGDGVVRKWALVIGISDYEGTQNDLQYCDDDAQDWKNFLQGEGYTITILTDREATAANIESKLIDLLTAEDADDYVVFAYSGHGTSYQGRDHALSQQTSIISLMDFLNPILILQTVTISTLLLTPVKSEVSKA
jgi:hypothetical protein